MSRAQPFFRQFSLHRIARPSQDRVVLDLRFRFAVQQEPVAVAPDSVFGGLGVLVDRLRLGELLVELPPPLPFSVFPPYLLDLGCNFLQQFGDGLLRRLFVGTAVLRVAPFDFVFACY